MAVGKILKICAAIIMVSVIIAFLIPVLAQSPELVLLICIASFGVMMIFIIKTRQRDVFLQLTQYLRDEKGEYYMVQFTKGASTVNELKQIYVAQDIRKAQDISSAYYYVKRFKAGYQDWDRFVGGETKVTPLTNLMLVKKGSVKSKYTYEADGRKKEIVIFNAYEGLENEFGI